MKILYLAHRIPYPPNKGDKIRSFNEIKYLSASHEIDLACLVDDPDDMRYGKDLQKYCRRVFLEPLSTIRAIIRGLLHTATGKPLSVGYFYSRSLQRIVDQWLAGTLYDGIICFSSPMAEYIFRSELFDSGNGSRSKNKTPRLIMDFCDVDSDKWAQYARRSSFPKSIVYSLENLRLAGYERIIADRFDHSVFVSEKEAELFKSKNPLINNISVIPNGVDSEYFNPRLSHPFANESVTASNSVGKNGCRPTLVFTGAMDYYANEDGIIWFCKQILPRIKTEIPEIKLFIVGRNPSKKVMALDDAHSIRVTGCVEDIRPYYSEADVCVIPLRISRGIQNKLLEAMAMGKAVVATSNAAHGMDAIPEEHFLLSDRAEQFAEAIVTLIGDEDHRRRLGTRARDYVNANYRWSAKMRLLDNLIGETVQR
ncbi:MAG: TIGR03087 family PEP-CTERM/XrtA system glycosyltransferase [Syntrophobacteraceae bacterium]|jgi:sugar transferase (PEP-CTERM/EpsH1 system associated)